MVGDDLPAGLARPAPGRRVVEQLHEAAGEGAHVTGREEVAVRDPGIDSRTTPAARTGRRPHR
ncbi:hypothetical protein [Streptomyces coeruleofuscus]|uniref:hypothetical protein n=1 Tax=Streptomyces coeruleofuscus TaxID=66879 RepID=UPI0031F8BB66